MDFTSSLSPLSAASLHYFGKIELQQRRTWIALNNLFSVHCFGDMCSVHRFIKWLAYLCHLYRERLKDKGKQTTKI